MSTLQQFRQRSRGWLNAVNLHWAGVGILVLVNVYFLVQMGFAWRLANSENADALAQQQFQLQAAQIAAKPLEGLDVKLAAANDQADKFYMERLPFSYSEIASQLGALKGKSSVRLSRVGYTQPLAAGAAKSSSTSSSAPVEVAPPSSGKNQLTEILMDASLTGDYRSLVTFINALERDKVFFLVNGITLTGQQTGQVSLRLRVTTYLRGAIPADEGAKAEAASAAGSVQSDIDNQTAAPSNQGKGGRR